MSSWADQPATAGACPRQGEVWQARGEEPPYGDKRHRAALLRADDRARARRALARERVRAALLGAALVAALLALGYLAGAVRFG